MLHTKALIKELNFYDDVEKYISGSFWTTLLSPDYEAIQSLKPNFFFSITKRKLPGVPMCTCQRTVVHEEAEHTCRVPSDAGAAMNDLPQSSLSHYWRWINDPDSLKGHPSSSHFNPGELHELSESFMFRDSWLTWSLTVLLDPFLPQ